jgi:hypothetical protein
MVEVLDIFSTFFPLFFENEKSCDWDKRRKYQQQKKDTHYHRWCFTTGGTNVCALALILLFIEGVIGGR